MIELDKFLNKTFGKLTALKVSHVVKKKSSGVRKYTYNKFYVFKCDCGNEKIIRGADVFRGRINSCGCIKKITAKNNTFKNLLGKRFGRLYVRRESGIKKNNRVIWECICDCGNIRNIRSGDLITKNTQSCGCLKVEVIKERRGPKHFAYNPLISEEERIDRRLNFEYKEWVKNIYKKYNFRCVICGSNKKIHAHHLYSFLYYKDLRWKLNNGVVLCATHHFKFHAKFGLGKNTKKQFNQFKLEEEKLNE